MLAGLGLSVLSATGMAAGNLLEKHAVDAMAELSVRRAGRMLASLLASRVWLAGFTVSLVGLCLQVVAFALAPLAVVQSAYGAGLVLVVIGSRVVVREAVAGRELAGLGVIVLAVVLVGSSLGSSDAVGLHGSSAHVVAVSALSALVAAALFAGARRVRGVDPGLAYGGASGIFYGIASLATKGASTFVAKDGILGSIPHLATSPYPYLFLAASVLGLLSFQAGLQRCRIGIVVPLSGVVSSSYVVVAGMALFSERLPGDVLSSVLRFTGFAGVLIGTALLAGGESGDRRHGLAAASSGHLLEASEVEVAVLDREATSPGGSSA